MTLALDPFADIPLDENLLEALIEDHQTCVLPRLERLWNYFRNALADPTDAGGSAGAPAQRVGLPERLINIKQLHRDDRFQREIVIENDIAWRIHTLVDFMFPSAPKFISKAHDADRRNEIESILNAIIEHNGGTALWQNAALLGAVYGHVDFMLDCGGLARVGAKSSATETADSRPVPRQSPSGAPSNHSRDALIEQLRSAVFIETVEAPRAIPLVNRHDYRVLDAYILHFRQPTNDVERAGILSRLTRAVLGQAQCKSRRASTEMLEIHSASRCQRYEDGVLVHETINRLGRLPIVHIQNLAQPLHYDGLSDVEPLIPLQDELNTRLSDRANRVTMQSFRMWLGKGIEGFIDRPVGPGQMWLTDNLDASIEAFGGDADSPSERAHIEELREALDKASGVTPAAAGHIKARVGNLTSENALRISLMGTIAKIKRKRVTYGAGIAELCELILHALDVHGVYRTTPAERRVELAWVDPLASDESRRIADALAKAQLGIPTSVLRAELGYPDAATNDIAEVARST